MVAALAPAVPELTLYDRQAAFVFDAARYPAFIAGRNSGKTRAGAIKAANRCASPGLGVIAAPSFPMLTHAAKRAFVDELTRRAAVDPRWSWVEHKSERILAIPATGAEVLFGSLDNPDSVRGPNFAWGWLDEPGYVTDEAWRNLKGSVREGDHPQLWPTGTPKGRNHFLYREWMVEPDADHTYHHATSLHNPFVDAATYVRSLGYSGVFAEQEIGGEFVAFEGIVYPRFSRVRHVQSVDCTGWAGLVCADTGTTNPTAVLTVRHAGDRRHVEHEVYRREMDSDEIPGAIESAYRAAGAGLAVIDPSSAGYIRTLQKRGVRAVKGVNDIILGIQEVTRLIANDLLTVDPACGHVIAEFEAYRYRDGAAKDVPEKADDHAMDALRYGCLALAAPKARVRFL